LTSPASKASAFFTRPGIVLLLATLCCVLWGSAYPAVKSGYLLFGIERSDLASQLVFAGLRFVGAGTILLVFAAFSGKSLTALPPGALLRLTKLGLFQTTLQYIFFYVGLAHTTGVKASILNAVGVFFSVLLAHFIYHNDALTWRKTMACALGFVGVMVVNLGGAGTMPLGLEFSLLGEGFIVFAAFVLSAATIYGKRVSQGMDTIVMTGYQLGLGGLVLWALGWAGGGQVQGFGVASSALLLYLCLLSAAAFSLWSLLLKYNRVSTVSVYNFLVPVFGAGLSALFLGESIWAWKNLVALVLVCIGIWWVTQEKQP
jgi:drug/metabolite transporter (DMT)-like permease